MEALSVTITFAWTVLPIYACGMVHAKEFDVDPTFVKSMFAIRAPVTVFVMM